MKALLCENHYFYITDCDV